MPFQHQIFIVFQDLIPKGKGYTALQVLLLMDFVRIFQTFHVCAFQVFGAWFVRKLDHVIVFHDLFAEFQQNSSEIKGLKGETKKYYENLVKFANVTKESLIAKGNCLKKSSRETLMLVVIQLILS